MPLLRPKLFFPPSIMKIIELRGENVKRMRAFTVKPDGNTIVVAGKNGQGKSSLLDSIVLALGGKSTEVAKLTTKPIRDGADDAWVEVDLGEYTVRRRWTAKSDSLEVTSKDGSKYPSPQKMLDKLIGDLSFDPLAFTRLPAKEQRAVLLEIAELDIDLDAWEKNYKDVFDKRTEIGREVKRLEGASQSAVTFQPDTPDEEVSVSETSKKLTAAQADAAEVRKLQSNVQNCDEKVAHINEQIKKLEQDRAATEAIKKQEAEKLEDLPSLEELDTAVSNYQMEIEQADEINKKVRAKKQYSELEKQLIAEQAKYEKGTVYLKEQEEKKRKALEEAQMPIDGLGIDADGVTYKELPFGQLSQAEQIKVSMAIAMAQNPELRVIRIDDGSLLDEDNMKAIAEMADANDFQIWVERVDSSGKVGVVIEDGMIVSDSSSK